MFNKQQLSKEKTERRQYDKACVSRMSRDHFGGNIRRSDFRRFGLGFASPIRSDPIRLSYVKMTALSVVTSEHS